MNSETSTRPRMMLPAGTTHVALRPLARNVDLSRQGAVLVQCESCGQDCWQRPCEIHPLPPGYVYRCTECGLRAGIC